MDQSSSVSQEFILSSKGEEDEKISYGTDDGDDYSENGKDTEEFNVQSSNGDKQSFGSGGIADVHSSLWRYNFSQAV